MEQLGELSPETQHLRRASNSLGPAHKALEYSGHVRAPETQVPGQTFIALLVSLWEARTLDWML